MEMRYTLPEPYTQLRRVSFAAANDILSSGLVTSFHFHMFQARKIPDALLCSQGNTWNIPVKHRMK